MSRYQYTAHAVDDGEVFTSTCYADNENQVRSNLERMGYTVDWVKTQKTDQIFGVKG
jgi:type II secretory pathway component PulF